MNLTQMKGMCVALIRSNKTLILECPQRNVDKATVEKGEGKDYRNMNVNNALKFLKIV
jgi:hypothetical protein